MMRTRSKGFTLTEVMIAVVISIMIFSAMGTLLSRCFSMWVDAQAQWKLAQHARVTRTRLLYGGFGIGTGLLNATNVSVSVDGAQHEVIYYPVTLSGDCSIFGWSDSGDRHILMGDNLGRMAYAQTVRRVVNTTPPVVGVNQFSASVSNSTVRLAYTLNLSAMGKTFELPQALVIPLINE